MFVDRLQFSGSINPSKKQTRRCRLGFSLLKGRRESVSLNKSMNAAYADRAEGLPAEKGGTGNKRVTARHPVLSARRYAKLRRRRRRHRWVSRGIRHIWFWRKMQQSLRGDAGPEAMQLGNNNNNNKQRTGKRRERASNREEGTLLSPRPTIIFSRPTILPPRPTDLSARPDPALLLRSCSSRTHRKCRIKV
uniref:Uncharacterized protein n=1 Tax=Physcomitrium patens TaxID=3218 RepID=A9STG1_PHYPA|nr:hypothetical protein PHYPA_009578 [Physcomitrium patens]